MICPYCHKNTPPNRDRCIYCGTTLNETRIIRPPDAEPLGQNTVSSPSSPVYGPDDSGTPEYHPAGGGKAPGYNPAGRSTSPGYGSGGGGMAPGYNPAGSGRAPGYNPGSEGMAPGYNPADRSTSPGYGSGGRNPGYGAGGSGMPSGYNPGGGRNPGYNPADRSTPPGYGSGGRAPGYGAGGSSMPSGYNPGGGAYGYNQAGGGRAPGYGSGGGMPPGYRPPGGSMPPDYGMDSGRLRSILLGWAPFLVLGVLLIVIVILFIVDPLHDSSEESSESSTTGRTAAAGDEADPEHAMVNGQNIPPDALEIGGNYYYVFTGLGLSSRAAAEQYCEDRGGHLAVITSQELNDRLYQLCLDSGVETAIFGYSDEKIEGNWEWVTDAQPGYTNWGRTEPNGAADGEDYAIFSSSEANGRWNDTQFGHETTDFICQWNDNGIVDEPIQVRIPDDAVKFDGHQYYLFDNGKSNWCEAQNFCKSIGGDLVVINNVDENQFLMDYIEDMGYDRAFIGYSDEESEGRWYWVSGKTSRFVDWGITRDGDVAPTNETRWYNFAEIDLQLTAGSWKDGVFGQDTTAYICEWE